MRARADYYSSHHQRARGHKTIGSHLKVAYYSFLGIKQKLTRAYACCHVSASARAEITRARKENPNKHGDCKKIYSSWLAL